MDDALLTVLVIVFGSLGAVGVLAVAYIFLAPEKLEKVAGWLVGGVAALVRRGHRTAIALKVQGAINAARAEFLKNAPQGILEKKVKIRWAKTTEEATSLLKEGEVLVVLRKSAHDEANIANALMAYLPKAMLPRARRYVDRERMRAADLIVAKSVLRQNDQTSGSLDVFFDEHLDPARAESDTLKTKIQELDEIDLEGWLIRVLLAEYKQLGDELYPSEPDEHCWREAEELARWLYKLAVREPGTHTASLSFRGRYFRIAFIWVAIRDRIEQEGLRPYRRRARRYLWRDQFDAVYLMARDANIEAVELLASELETDVRVETAARYRYALRSDFRKRKLPRYESIIVCLRRRHGPGDEVPYDPDAEEGPEPDPEIPESVFDSSEVLPSAAIEVAEGGPD
jgi:hypothetical protein